MRYVIEIKDERDKDSPEPWSHFAAGTDGEKFERHLTELVRYMEQWNNPISEVRIKLERE